MESFREPHGRLRGFAGVKRPRLAEKRKTNREKKRKNSIRNGFLMLKLALDTSCSFLREVKALLKTRSEFSALNFL